MQLHTALGSGCKFTIFGKRLHLEMKYVEANVLYSILGLEIIHIEAFDSYFVIHILRKK